MDLSSPFAWIVPAMIFIAAWLLVSWIAGAIRNSYRRTPGQNEGVAARPGFAARMFEVVMSAVITAIVTVAVQKVLS